MAQISQIDILSRTLQIIRLMAREEGATVTEISKETGIDRWTVRDMIDRMENFNPDGKGLYIEESQDENDKRATRYKVPKEHLWTLTLPGMNLSDDEALLLALMFNQGFASPDLHDSALALRKKMNMFRNFKEYEVLNLSSAKKITTKETQKAIVAILNAIRDGKCINFSYKPVRRDVTEYQLMPLGVFRYDNGFYLAAQKLPDGEYRSFGLERVVGRYLKLHEQRRLDRKYTAVMSANLDHLVFLDELECIAYSIAVKCDLLKALVVHEIVQISVAVQVLHVFSINTCLGELLRRTERFLHNTAVYDIL